MPKYLATVTTTFEIEAENIMEARRIAGGLRTVGERVGSRRVQHNRDAVSYSCTRLETDTRLVRLSVEDELTKEAERLGMYEYEK